MTKFAVATCDCSDEADCPPAKCRFWTSGATVADSGSATTLPSQQWISLLQGDMQTAKTFLLYVADSTSQVSANHNAMDHTVSDFSDPFTVIPGWPVCAWFPQSPVLLPPFAPPRSWHTRHPHGGWGQPEPPECRIECDPAMAKRRRPGKRCWTDRLRAEAPTHAISPR